MRVFTILFFLSVSLTHAQELERISQLEDYPEWAHVTVAQENPKLVEQPSLIASIAISCFRAKFCNDITQAVSKNNLVVHNRFFSISEHAACRFSWDVISYAFLDAMKGKEIDEIWYPAFNQACTNVATQKVSLRLCRVIVPDDRNIRNYKSEFVKDLIRDTLAASIVYVGKLYVIPVVQKSSLALFKAVLAKAKN